MYTVVTSFGPLGWNKYAKAFVDSFYEHFDPHVALLAYWEGPRPPYGGLLPGYSLTELPASAGFLARHRGSLEVQGRREGRARWASKAKKEGYSYRHDAYKFARKVFAVADAARRQHRGRLFWIDADVVVQKPVSLEFLRERLPDEISLCYLKRRLAHSELGFVGYNLELLETHAFITAYEREYAEDLFLDRAHWDDCSVFDALVAEIAPSTRRIKHHSEAQPFDHSVLGQYMIHNKGKRKDLAA